MFFYDKKIDYPDYQPQLHLLEEQSHVLFITLIVTLLTQY